MPIKKNEQAELESRKRISIRSRFMKTVLLTTVVSILAVSITGIFCIRWIRSATETTLTEQLKTNLTEVVHEHVISVESKLSSYEKYIEIMTDSLDSMYSARNEMISRGKTINPPSNSSEYGLSRSFASENAREDLTEKELEDDLKFFSNMESVWAPIVKENKGLINSMYIGTKAGLLVSYNRYAYLNVPPRGREAIYNYFVSDWYKKGMKDDGVIYTGVYMNPQGRGLTITIGSAFKNEKGEPAGVVCIDFDLAALYDELFTSEFDEDAFTFAIDHENKIISPESDLLDVEEYTGLTLDELDGLKEVPVGTMEKDDMIYVSYNLEKVGWTMCTRVPRSMIQSSIHESDKSIRQAVLVFLAVVVLILAAAIYAVNKSVNAIIHPLELLERDIKIISDGNLDYRADVYRNDEIGDITSGMNEMVDRLNFTLKELMSSQQHADAMSRLATLDSLTGIRNKTAFDNQLEVLEEEFEKDEKEFGFVMIDLNNLKLINDNYGHDKGDISIKKLCGIICDVFAHSPVYRVGGDEFIVLLQNEDFNNVESLVSAFRDRMRATYGDKSALPWDRISAAIGYALYDLELDDGIDSVKSRADKEMYECKREMKGKGQPSGR